MKRIIQCLKGYLHDPLDKCFDIPTHEQRAKNFADILGIDDLNEAKGADMIASCMERSLLPDKIIQAFTEIKHPLSEGVLKIDSEISIDDATKVYKKIASEVSGDEKIKFFYIWRNLQELIFEEFQKKEWVKYIGILPADTRIPDHSIWEHLKIASAIQALWDDENKLLYQNNSLFLFTLGPVQTFIAQARKTVDFFMGSYILSYLTFIAMENLIDAYGPTSIIYPDLFKQPLMDNYLNRRFNIEPKGFDIRALLNPTIPNRFVAIIPETDQTEIEKLAKSLEDKVRNKLKEVQHVIFERLSINLDRAVKNKIISQTSEFPEIYWVAIPWKLKERDLHLSDLKPYYSESILQGYEKLWKFATNHGKHKPNIGLLYEIIYSTLEKSMGARKNIRCFSQPLIEEKGRKCSVCGERDVVFFNEQENKKKFTAFNKDIIDITEHVKEGKIPLKFLAFGEGLCSICFMKRTFEIYFRAKNYEIFRDFSFPSVAEIACSDFKEFALTKTSNEYFDFQQKAQDKFGEKFQDVHPLPKLREYFRNIKNLEGEWFYEENLRKEYIEKQLGLSLSEETVKELKSSLKLLKETVGREPNSYYAIIHFDGDDMGKWLSGELLPDVSSAYAAETWKNLEDRKIQQDGEVFSFSQKLREILSDIKGHSKKLLTPSIHASISVALRNYSVEFVRKIVEEEHLGKLVYAGGDDVLAFINLRDLLDVMHKLRWAFSGHIKIENGQLSVDPAQSSGFVFKDGRYILTMGANATASMGVVIAHYKAPLQIAIRSVFEMERKAKSMEGKDAFAICLMRRSGEERVAKLKWSYDSRDTIEILKDLKNVFDEENERGHISKSFIQKLNSVMMRLKNEKGYYIGFEEIFNTQLLRLLHRSFNSPKGKRIEDSEKDKFIKAIYERMRTIFWDGGGNLDNFLNLCTILIFLLKGEA